MRCYVVHRRYRRIRVTIAGMFLLFISNFFLFAVLRSLSFLHSKISLLA